jgi:tetratricopeptide (TPR) repeat protein
MVRRLFNTISSFSISFYIQLLVVLFMPVLVLGKTGLPEVKRLPAPELLKLAVKRADPIFSAEALVARLNGLDNIAVEVTVSASGDVIAARFVNGFSLLKDAAIEAARKWKFTSSPKKDFLPIVGVIYFETPHEMQGNLPFKLSYYQKEVEQEPQSWLSQCRLGRAYIEANQYWEAEQVYKKAISLAPNSAVAFYGLGDSYFRQKLHEKALEAYQQAVKLNPKFIEAYYAICWRYRALNKPELALDTLRQAITISPDPNVKSKAYEDIAGIYKELQKTIEEIKAREQFVQVKLERKAIDSGLERDFSLAVELSTLASLYKSVGRLQEAAVTDCKSYDADPTSEIGFFAILEGAALYKKLERPLEAENIYSRLLRETNSKLKRRISVEQEGGLYLTKGIIYEEMEQYGKALKAYQHASVLVPYDVRTHSILRSLYLKQGNQSAADQEGYIMKKLDEGYVRSLKESTTVTKIK